jgi:hypothetical protein
MASYSIVTPSPPRTGVKSCCGELRLTLVSFVFDSSYATGGEAFDPKTDYPNLFGTILAVLPLQKAGFTFEWDSTNKKLKAFRYDYAAAGVGAAIEVANAVDLSVNPGTVQLLIVHR